MAVSRGNKSFEGSTLYIGIGSSYVLNLNPSKQELEKLFGRSQDSDVEYLTTVEDNGMNIKQMRLDFIVHPNPSKYFDSKGNPIDVNIHAPIFLKQKYVFGDKTGKYKVIDKYGRTAWATKDDVENHRIPVYRDKDGNEFQARISNDYIVCYEGLEELTKLIRAYLNIPSVEKWEDKKVVGLIDNPSDAEVLPENIEGLFKGDISEIKEIFGYQPENEVKLPYTVRNTQDGKQYQGVYMKFPINNGTTKYTKLIDEITMAKNRGSLNNIEFDFEDLHEYILTPTSFKPASNPEKTSPW